MIIWTAHQTFEDAAVFVANKLLPKNRCQTLITISEEEMHSDFMGLTEQCTNEIIITINPNIPTKDKTETVIHEMIHACQIIKKDLDINKKTWKGKKITHHLYSEYPWEKEAYQLEKELIHEYQC